MNRISLPKNALQRVDVGKAFAEYDLIRKDQQLFVSTPATLAALDPSGGSCFFIGRRGAGKTAIVFEIQRKFQRTISLAPQIFDLLELPLNHEEFRDTRQRPFKSLMHSLERALVDEVIRQCVLAKIFDFRDAPETIRRERNLIEDCDFDQRVLNLTEEIFQAYSQDQDKLWLRQIKRSKQLVHELKAYEGDGNFNYLILIDRLDESWDGSDSAIICLMALMHATVRLTSSTECVKPYVFIRENIYDRIRNLDNEFARLETSVVFLDWSEAKLTELVERRLVRPFTTKPALGGEAWGYFFEDIAGTDSREIVMRLCQHRPRDVLMLVSYAIDSAINNSHQKIDQDDLEAAALRYSTSRLKDLGDEFAENYPNISFVLEYFYGLGTQYSYIAIERFIQKLLVTEAIQKYCKDWFYDYSTPFRFIGLLFNIGFMGIQRRGEFSYKESGKDSNAKPAIDSSSVFAIHPTYHSALNLREIIMQDLADDVALQNTGILEELPENFRFNDYKEKLSNTLNRLRALETGRQGATEFEEIVGGVIQLCFFRSLTNAQPKVRTYEGSTIRDWVVSNRAVDGFWEVIRTQYGATQVVWECKNYEDLSADDFHQVSYYLNDTFGHFGIIAFRGTTIDDRYFKHISNIVNKNRNGMIIVLTQKDLEVFLRQAISGNFKEAHIQDRFDFFIRKIA